MIAALRTARPVWTPVIILGAARSGTNMLRDALSTFEECTTWPCDEINYVWRHGNARVPHDELGRRHARPRTREYIRRQFHMIADGHPYVVEKTCANSLRVGFVDEVLPDARFVVIVRDGRDVAASARRRWTAPIEPRYLARKSRYVPPSDLPYYASRYALNRLRRMVSPESRLSTWGPRPRGFDQVLRAHSLLEACAMQWRASVDRCDEQLSDIDSSRVHRVSYEDFVEDPIEHLSGIARFIGCEPTRSEVLEATSFVTTANRRKAQRELTPDELRSLQPILAPTLERHGYA